MGYLYPQYISTRACNGQTIDRWFVHLLNCIRICFVVLSGLQSCKFSCMELERDLGGNETFWQNSLKQPFQFIEMLWREMILFSLSMMF